MRVSRRALYLWFFLSSDLLVYLTPFFHRMMSPLAAALAINTCSWQRAGLTSGLLFCYRCYSLKLP